MIREKNIKVRLFKTVFWSLCVAVVLTCVLNSVGVRIGELIGVPSIEELVSNDILSRKSQQDAWDYLNQQQNVDNKKRRAFTETFLLPLKSTNKSSEMPLLKAVSNTSASVSTNNMPRPKVTHIGFLKVHKAGSSTMQNMFFRFGLNNGLNIVTPKGIHYIYSNLNVFVPKHVTHFDIFACHTIYSKTFYDEILPVDSIKIGIIREPFDRMMSAAYYYRDALKRFYLNVPKKHFIRNLVNYPDVYDKGPFSRTRNSMGRDFGFSKTTKITDKHYIQKHLNFLDQEFSLVMVTERFEESLVLMRRLLNWSMSDILFLTSNSHNHTTTKLSVAEKKKFRSTNFLDYAIYEFFLSRLNAKVQLGGDDLANEVNFF